ncbi:hypothetical protein GOP47_0001980 [Adiantum capillus-veneris]|uniref:C2H2-type domain-containing protein n=1 Tax=Adiantum capillus-veneris TaxID=13818 RepID=A0A9D4ZQN7_ADICA|nr:hypothetical protein GOP47_0001980 [Adiantum capillus-veneris]
MESRATIIMEEDELLEWEEEDEGDWEDWVVHNSSEEYVCLFCPSSFASTTLLFDHCSLQHAFDFQRLREDHSLGFYDCIRLINFIRSQVACNRCWACGSVMDSGEALLEHVKSKNHVAIILRRTSNASKESLRSVDEEHDSGVGCPWQDDKYLTPFLENDPLLYSFEENSDDDDDASEEKVIPQDVTPLLEKTELKSLLLAASCGADAEGLVISATDKLNALTIDDLHTTDLSASRGQNNGHSHKLDANHDSDTSLINEYNGSAMAKKHSNKLKVSFAKVAARERYSINQSYFGSYSTFGIHREMLSDRIRTDAYQNAIMRNPSLLKDAVVMDLGCGTGILSLFAAKAGAQKVIAVDGSKRMSVVAQHVAKSNGFLNENNGEENREKGAVISVVEGMIEELDFENLNLCGRNSVDVLVSEWMGYCLLFESMLNSVLFARDRWLKPGGAILPDKAEMYVAGFGVGGTSLPFWESVYGFDMTSIGKQVLEDAASSLIVDVVESKDIVTNSCLLQTFDLVTMADSDVDFTASFELSLLASLVMEAGQDSVVCYGLVVWFDTQFSSRFCQENPVVLSTSPHTPKTHWSQTLLTLQEPVCLAISTTPVQHSMTSGKVGTAASPAIALKGRISIARSSRHRSIDISLEMVAVAQSGSTHEWPVQMFDM